MLEFRRENSETDRWGPPVRLTWRGYVVNLLSWTRVPPVNDSSIYLLFIFLFYSRTFSSGHFNKQVTGAYLRTARRSCWSTVIRALAAVVRPLELHSPPVSVPSSLISLCLNQEPTTM